MTWTEYEERDSWPDGREYHIAACLGYGGQHKTALISGGWNGDDVTHDDMWLLDPQSGKIVEVRNLENNLYLPMHSIFSGIK